jgi:hypothetical protein
MQTLMCDGCGKGELLSTPEKKRTIRTVKLSVIHDTRESLPNSNERHEADLCAECQTILLSRYFRVKHGRILEIPQFLEFDEAKTRTAS